MNKINILYLTTDSKLGGAERVLLSLIRQLDSSRFNFTVCTLSSEGPFTDLLREKGIDVVSLKVRNKFDILRPLYLYIILRRKRIDILHSHLFHANVCALLIGRLARVPFIIITQHCEHLRGIEGMHRFLICKFIWRFSDRVIAISPSVENFLLEKIRLPQEKVVRINNGIALSPFGANFQSPSRKRLELNIPSEEKVVGTIARLHPQKGLTYLIQAVPIVLKKFPNVTFIIIGEGLLRDELKALTMELRIENNVRFLGRRHDVGELFTIVNVFVLPSLWEGLSIALLEAMAMGKPVIATDISANRDVIKNRVTGLLTPPRDSEALAEAIVNLLGDGDLAINLSQNAQRHVKENFNAREMAQRTIAVYEALINRK